MIEAENRFVVKDRVKVGRDGRGEKDTGRDSYYDENIMYLD